jgi:uncharacterized membrane protein HdeD (DUF308 family)
MNDILAGAVAMASAVVVLFFLRFWKSTRDRFFLYFAISFLIEGCSRIFLTHDVGDGEGVQHYLFYILRLVAYGLIVIAVLDKNRRAGKSK